MFAGGREALPVPLAPAVPVQHGVSRPPGRGRAPRPPERRTGQGGRSFKSFPGPTALTRASTSARCVEIDRPGPYVRLRLFCFPYAGGGAAVYRSWGGLLPREIQPCPVNLRGRGSRFTEAPLERLEAVTESLAEELAPHLDVPFAFFGHSMGALIAFELTRLLRR